MCLIVNFNSEYKTLLFNQSISELNYLCLFIKLNLSIILLCTSIAFYIFKNKIDTEINPYFPRHTFALEISVIMVNICKSLNLAFCVVLY